LTYGQQGVLKYGVNADDHTVVYSEKGPQVLDREVGLMTKKPIRIDIRDKSHKLDPLSRLNYAKLYTVEHNVKVLFIGRVAKHHEQDVVIAFNQTHPPVPSRPTHSYRPDSPVFSHTGGADPVYPPAIPDPTGSTGWGTSGADESYYPAPTPYSPPTSQPYTHPLVFNPNPQISQSGQHEPPPQEQYHQPTYDDGYERD
jgi:hypothetical protein